jgi:hypothetical protein
MVYVTSGFAYGRAMLSVKRLENLNSGTAGFPAEMGREGLAAAVVAAPAWTARTRTTSRDVSR